MPRGSLLALFGAVVIFSIGAVALGSGEPVRLGSKWSPYNYGYGKVRPRTVYNGGDPTGMVRHIHWRNWGERRAVGEGVSTYVRPMTTVSENGPIKGARIVAFHLGRCHGRRAYNAVEWYFPKFGGRFHPGYYINACNGKYVGKDRVRDCKRIATRDGAGVATEILAERMRCRPARMLIARSPARRYRNVRGWHQFRLRGFRCGVRRDAGGGVAFECDRDLRGVLWSLRG